ncbi:hypothetical protein C8R47DRAFT_1322131 [Mycena vitilis]|nr:hypothetical protein C8R47DRAFT_1322131 [Mycena vitilis]
MRSFLTGNLGVLIGRTPSHDKHALPPTSTTTTRAGMAPPQNPLAVQELLDYCLDFLHTSAPDLKRCSLVSRYWTPTAQKHLFNRLIIGSARYAYGDSKFLAGARERCNLLCAVLDTSPQILRLVESLQIHLDTIPLDVLTYFLTRSFPSLRSVSVSGNWMPITVSILRELLSRDGLTSISISGNFNSLSELTSLLERCAPSITGVCFSNVRTPPAVIAIPESDHRRSMRRISVDALELAWSPTIRDWLNAPECPFEFSGLRRLRLHANADLPSWPAFTACIPHVEYLQFHVFQRHLSANPPVILRPFTALRTIEFFIEFFPDVASTLSILATLPSANRVEVVRFRFTQPAIPSKGSGPAIDAQLSEMPCLRAVELVYMHPAVPVGGVETHLPSLYARRMVRVVRAGAYE